MSKISNVFLRSENSVNYRHMSVIMGEVEKVWKDNKQNYQNCQLLILSNKKVPIIVVEQVEGYSMQEGELAAQEGECVRRGSQICSPALMKGSERGRRWFAQGYSALTVRERF